jgi:hypothetical protein
METDLEYLEHHVRILAYYIRYWYQNSNELTQLEKNKLFKIYQYLVNLKPTIEQIVSNKLYYSDIMESLNKYKADQDDFEGQAQLYDLKQKLLDEFKNYLKKID